MSTFRSMGCEIVVPAGMPVDDIRSLFERRDSRFSRFLPSSELNRVNDHPLGLALVSEEFASMLSLSLDAARATDGLVTPCVGGAILAAGYDRDFSQLPPDVGVVWPAAIPSFRSISLRTTGLLRTDTVLLDLNGVVKGRTVDDALALAGRGWVSAGGDVAAAEPVVIGLPGGESVTLHEGGLATSSIGVRRWRANGIEVSHLIDPRTGFATSSPWRDVTVAAGTCLAADVAAKAALLLGDDGPDWLDDHGYSGRFVARDGTVQLSRLWAERAPAQLAA